MKSYPSIQFVRDTLGKVPGTQHWFVFDKLDGSNIRAEWNRKKGFDKFGTRRRLLDASDPQFGEAISLIMEGYSNSLSKIFSDQRWDRAVAFFEFYGDNSFAGNHQDEAHRVTLIDVAPHKKGLLMPEDFVDLFEDIGIAPLLHKGPVDISLVEKIVNGVFEVGHGEGVVMKTRPPNNKPQPLMCKVKTKEWLSRLRHFCKDDESLFEQLK